MVNSSFSNAISAYGATATRPVDTSPNKNEDSVPAGEAFSSLVKNVVEDTVDASRKSERLSMQAIAGEADMREVVAAVANAEIALETVVAVRDSVVRAYQDVLRMPL